MICSRFVLPRGTRPAVFLLGFCALLVPVVGTLALPERHLEWSGILWLLALVPLFQLAYRFGWPGAAAGMGGTVGLVVLVHLAAAPLGRGAPLSLAWVLPVLLATGAAFGWMSHRLREGSRNGAPDEWVDAATGLPSERHARLLLQNEFWSAERGRLLTLIIFELVGLDDEAEAEAVSSFGQILASTTRRMNLSARCGPLRFMSILDGTDEEGASRFAERVRDAYASTRPEGETLRIRAGIAGYHPSMNGPDDLVAAAALALERAGEDGADLRIFGHPGTAPGDVPAPGRTSAHLDGLGSPTTGPARGAREATGRVALAGDGRRILLVEADTSTRTLISTHLQKQGFSVTEATGASEAIRALSEEFDLFITDLQSQQSPGVRLVATLKARWPDTPAVAVTGFQDAQLAAEALTAGADRYLYRPFGMPELEAHLEDLLKFRERLLERREERAETRSGSLGYGPGAREAVLDALRALVRAAELRDPATRGHAERVRAYTLILAEALSGHAVRKLDRDALGLAGELMDVGKITVPEGILTKEGALSDREYEKVREHPRAGRSLLEPLLDDDVILAATAWHHERWDGQGYPDGLAGQAIPLPARIVAVADALDAMTSPRAYRPGLEWNDAVGQIRARSGTHFDPGLLSAFETALDRLRQIYEAAFPDGTPPAPEGGDAPREGDRTGGSSTSSDSPSDRAYDAAPPEEER